MMSHDKIKAAAPRRFAIRHDGARPFTTWMDSLVVSLEDPDGFIVAISEWMLER